MTNREYYRGNPRGLERAWRSSCHKVSLAMFKRLEHVDPNEADIYRQEAIFTALSQLLEAVNEIRAVVQSINERIG